MTPTMFVDTVNSQLGAVKISSGTKLEVVPRFVNLAHPMKRGKGSLTVATTNTGHCYSWFCHSTCMFYKLVGGFYCVITSMLSSCKYGGS